MLKVLGSICVLGTSALLGIQKGAEIQRVYEELLYLQRPVSYTHLTLPTNIEV